MRCRLVFLMTCLSLALMKTASADSPLTAAFRVTSGVTVSGDGLFQAVAGTPVTFEAHAVGWSLRYTWVFSDGAPEVGPHASHIFSRGGIATATLAVEDTAHNHVISSSLNLRVIAQGSSEQGPGPQRDAYVIWVNAANGIRAEGATQIWQTELLVHNGGSDSQSMHLVGASNGVTLPISDPVSIAPGKTRLIDDLFGTFDGGLPMLVAHLEIGETLGVASRLISKKQFGADVATPPPPVPTGSVPLPVFYQLIPAGEVQVLPFVDLPGLPSRINLSLYNAGGAVAHALVEVVSACDDRLVSIETFSISANTIQQFPLGPPPGCDFFDQVSDGPTYLRVTLDQDGFAIAAVRADGVDATIPASVLGSLSP
jgi:hypothetical protein